MVRNYKPRSIMCSATSKTTGKRCQRPALLGITVCQLHGGAAPQSRAVHLRTLEAMVGPALERILELIGSKHHAVALAASKDVLDRTGYKLAEKIESDGRTLIQIEYVGRPMGVQDFQPALAEGRPLIEFLGLDDEDPPPESAPGPD
jgi:hypothetical protein